MNGKFLDTECLFLSGLVGAKITTHTAERLQTERTNNAAEQEARKRT